MIIDVLVTVAGPEGEIGFRVTNFLVLPLPAQLTLRLNEGSVDLKDMVEATEIDFYDYDSRDGLTVFLKNSEDEWAYQWSHWKKIVIPCDRRVEWMWPNIIDFGAK